MKRWVHQLSIANASRPNIYSWYLNFTASFMQAWALTSNENKNPEGCRMSLNLWQYWKCYVLLKNSIKRFGLRVQTFS